MKQSLYKKNKLALIFALLFSFVLVPQLQSQNGTKNSKKDLENKKKRINDEIVKLIRCLAKPKQAKNLLLVL